jgi:hypothetical protein
MLPGSEGVAEGVTEARLRSRKVGLGMEIERRTPRAGACRGIRPVQCLFRLRGRIVVGLLEWALRQKYDSEKALLTAYLAHAEAWYNELTAPLKNFVYEMHFNLRVVEPRRYAEMARDMYFRQIESNRGNDLKNTMEQMGGMGIPLFSHRHKLQRRTKELLDSGHFLKEFVSLFHGWDDLSDHQRIAYRRHALESWNRFKECKDRLVTEINRQMRRLG